MLITILGGLGSGKTLLTVILSYYQKRKIITNFSLYFDLEKYQIEEFNLDKFIRTEYEDCIILLDECYTYLESRISGSENNRIMSYILFQSRKKNVELYCTAQLLSSIDKRFRQLSDIFILANNNIEEKRFEYTVIVKENQLLNHVCVSYESATLFFELYNTNEVIQTTNKKVLFNTKEPDEKLEDLQTYADEIRDYYAKQDLLKVTKSMVDLYITSHNNIPKFLSENIFALISLDKKLKRQKESKKSKKGKNNE